VLRDPASAPPALERQGAAVSAALLAPLPQAPRGRDLFVVPEGDLYRVSWAALPQGKRYAVESGLRAHTLAHESDLLAAPRATRAAHVLLAGAPDFARPGGAVATRRTLCLGAAEEGFAAIPHAAEELGALQRLLAAGRDPSEIRLLTGADATKERVRDALPEAEIVHLATHGFSLDTSCAEAGSKRGITLQATAEETAALPPLSGLAFAGASLAEARAPIGILSAAELAGLDLGRADWGRALGVRLGHGPHRPRRGRVRHAPRRAAWQARGRW
jgi:hypothetical protein